MTSFHLPPPYCPPTGIRMLTARLLREPYVTTPEAPVMHPDRDNEPVVDWSTVSSNVIATVLGAAVVAVMGAIFWTAYQVPRQQDLILQNQDQIRTSLSVMANRIDRLESNDRVLENRLIKIEK